MATGLSHAQANETTTILLFGDSIIAGYGLNEKDAVPAQLEQALREHDDSVRVINGGVSGDTTGAGRSRLEWTLDKHNPDMVVLALGGNDVLRGLPISVTTENILAMLELLKERNIPTILSAVQAPGNLGIAYQRQLNSLYKDASEKYEAPLYPFLLTETFGKKALMQQDGIHPNAEGAKTIANDLAEYLKEVLEKQE